MMETIGFLGCGNMGGAIARAVCKAADPKKVYLANRTTAKAQALAKELGPSHITVNCVAPGVIDTEMNGNLSPEELDALREECPLGTLGSTADVAETILFLASERGRFFTGQVLSPNGGFVI